MHDPDSWMSNPAQLDGFIQEAVQRLREKKAREDAFRQSPLFVRLLDSFRKAQEPVSLHDEELAYQREESLQRLGWSDVSEDDIDLFVSTLLDVNAVTVEPGSLQVNEESSFQNARFRHFGVNVWVMYGQGTAWSLANDAAMAQPQQAAPVSSADLAVAAALPEVVAGLLAGAARDEEQAFEQLRQDPAAQRALDFLRRDKLRDFDMALPYRWRLAMRGLIRQVHPTDRLAQFVVEQAGFVENQVRSFIQQHEGTACCSDKTRWVMSSFLSRSRTGVPIVADYTQQYTFHLPTKVLCTDASIVAFLEATQHLFYGDVERFVTVRSGLLPDGLTQ